MYSPNKMASLIYVIIQLKTDAAFIAVTTNVKKAANITDSWLVVSTKWLDYMHVQKGARF
jgi:hypothetical protein